MINDSRLRLLSLKVGKVFLADRHKKQWNFQVAQEIGAEPTKTHPILKRFEQQGWLMSCREQDNERANARKLYELTEAGAKAITAMLKPLQLASS